MAVDPQTGSDIVIQFEHYKVHDSEMYSTGYYFTVTAASTKEFLMVASASADPHVVFGVAVSGQSLVKLYEGVTTSVLGSSVTVFNMHRDSSNSCGSTFFHTPTWSTNTETLLTTELLPGGDKNQTRVGSSARQTTEWILEESTKYLIQITNQAGSTIGASVGIQFYELDL